MLKYYPTDKPTIPSVELEEFLTEEWNVKFVPRPAIFSQNDGVSPLRHNLTNCDIINIIPGSPAQDLQPIGNWTFGHYLWKIQLDLWTIDSRDRLWNLNHEVMNISLRNLHKIPNFQRITYRRFTELADKQVNLWHGRVDLELESKAVRLRDPLDLD